MHAEALDWLTAQLDGVTTPNVVDIGGRDINGNLRSLLPDAQWTGIDLHPGPCVEVVADCRDWAPPAPVGLVICAEVLEHAPDPQGVIAAAHDYLAPGGVLLLTAASDPREPHSGLHGGGLEAGEHYGNISRDDLEEWLDGWSEVTVVWHPHGDVYARAVK
jgi:SAM-dependent methyltransferase